MFTGFFQNRRVQVGFGILGFFVLLAIFGDLINSALGIHPLDVDYDNVKAPPLTPGHLLGTTSSGQDVLAQTIAGARGSITVGVIAALISIALATIVGVTSGFVGGVVDHALNGLTNVVLTMPSFPLTLIIAGYIIAAGGTSSPGMGLLTMALLIGAFEWPGGARYLRSQTLSLRGRDFSMATKMLGERLWRQIFVEILPHLMGILSARFLQGVIAGIMAEAGLNFLGVATQGAVSWGTMINGAQNQAAMTRGLWWWMIPPGLCIALVGTATALINFGLDEVTNPKLRTANRRIVRRFEKQRAQLLAQADTEEVTA